MYSKAYPNRDRKGADKSTGKLADSLARGTQIRGTKYHGTQIRGTKDHGTQIRGTGGMGFIRAASFQLMLIIVMAVFFIGSPAAWAAQSIVVDDINIGSVGEDEFFAGYAFIPSRAIFWESDTPWRVTVSSLDPDLGISDDGTYIKSLGDLHWKLSDEETWLPMTQEDEEIEWGTETGEGVIYVDFAVQLAWLKDVPGQYGTELVFTIESL